KSRPMMQNLDLFDQSSAPELFTRAYQGIPFEFCVTGYFDRVKRVKEYFVSLPDLGWRVGLPVKVSNDLNEDQLFEFFITERLKYFPEWAIKEYTHNGL